MGTLPDWMLVQEDERLRVAALSFKRASTRHEWVARLQQFADYLTPGFSLVPLACEGDATPPKATWKPLAVRQMPAPLQPDLVAHGATFSADFVHNELRGTEWSPGFYFILPEHRQASHSFTAYWVLDADIDPYLPREPGEHGAKLTPFFNSTLSQPGRAPTEEDYMNTPVFIGKNHTYEYRYFGHYSQTRFSDKLDYERMTDGTVPPFVLDVWAKNLTSSDLAPWLNDALRTHIWPKPVYEGPLPRDIASGTASPDGGDSPIPKEKKTTASSDDHDRRVKDAIKRYSEKLQEWEIDSRLKLSLLKEADVHRLFRAPDSDAEVGIRLWFEYLQCTSYEHSFYETLVEIQCTESMQRGYAEKLQERMRQGWQWQLVEVTAGSGHSRMERQLCPPPTRVPVTIKAPASRKDSVTGRAQNAPLAAQESTTKHPSSSLAGATPRVENEAATSPDKTVVLPSPSSRTVPPHLRHKMAKQDTSPQKAESGTMSSSTPKPTPAAVFPTGDIEEARRMNASFTKVKARRGDQPSLPSDSPVSQKEPEKNDLMNYGWARAARNQKVVPINSNKNVIW